MGHYLDLLEGLYREVSLEEAVDFGKIIQFLCDKDKTDIHSTLKIKNAYYSGIRKSFSKNSVKTLPFYDQMEILKALPPVEGDAY